MEYQNDQWPQFSSNTEGSAPTPPPPPLQEPAEDNIPPLKPNNWLWQSILATILCCLPLGIVGIIYAVKVDTLYYKGMYQEAERAAQRAKTWMLIAIVVGFLYIIYWIYLFATGTFQEYMDKIIENNASGYNF